MAERELNYAGFWIRLFACLIDTVLFLCISLPLLYAVYGLDYFIGMNETLVAGVADFLISWVFPGVASIIFWVARQATPGKIALSLRIVDVERGAEPTLVQYVGRMFAYFVSMLPFCLGFLWIAVDSRKQGFHDKLAGTVVVRDRSPR